MQWAVSVGRWPGFRPVMGVFVCMLVFYLSRCTGEADEARFAKYTDLSFHGRVHRRTV